MNEKPGTFTEPFVAVVQVMQEFDPKIDLIGTKWQEKVQKLTNAYPYPKKWTNFNEADSPKLMKLRDAER